METVVSIYRVKRYRGLVLQSHILNCDTGIVFKDLSVRFWSKSYFSTIQA